MESQSNLHNNESPSIAAEIEATARQLMGRGELLTWSYDQENNLVTLYTPDDMDQTEYPESIFGVPTAIVSLPRPVLFGGEIGEKSPEQILKLLTDTLAEAEQRDVTRDEFRQLFKSAVVLLGLNQDETAGIMKTGRPTVERWTSGRSAPHRVGRPSVFRELRKVASDRIQQESN